MLRANQKQYVLIDTVTERVILRSGRKACIDASRELAGPCELLDLAAGLVLEVKKPAAAAAAASTKPPGPKTDGKRQKAG